MMKANSNDPLAERVRIRGLYTRNRICVPPMVCFYRPNDDGGVLDRSVEHYRAIAKGGAGLIIQEATCVSSDGKLADCQIGIWDDGQIPGLRRLTEAVHAEGCPIFVQIHHAGFKSVGVECPKAPSAYEWTNPRSGNTVTARELTGAELQRIRQDFIDGARRAFEAGYDGVELHGCHEYLIGQILDPMINKRTDRYGAEPTRFVTEIVEGIRAVVPDSFIIGIRIAGCEPSLEDGLRNVAALESCMDFLDVSAGFIVPGVSFREMPEDYPFNPFIWMAQQVKERVSPSVPVFAVNGIDLPEQAREILALTGVDMVDIARSVLVDPAWAAKTLRGERPGHCLRCKQCVWMTGNCPGQKKFGT